MKRPILSTICLIATVGALGVITQSSAFCRGFFLVSTIELYDRNELDKSEDQTSGSYERFLPTSELDREITPSGGLSVEERDDSVENRRLVERKRVNQVVAINVLFLLLLLSIFHFKRRARRVKPR